MAVAMLASCSPLGTFNAIVPQDRGATAVERGSAYGTHPRQQLDLYRPKAWRAGQAGLPIVVFLYGGSWQEGGRGGYEFVARAFADAGFLVAVPDYRLVPEVRFPAFLEDSAAAVRWVRANATRFGGDPDRIVIVGHSAGAYNAAMLALDDRWLGEDRQALRGLVGLAGPYDFLPLDTAVTVDAFGQERDLESTQPISFASAGDPPALLLHGDRDTTVYPRNSERLASILRAAGVEAQLKLYPDLGHVGIITALARPFRGRAPVLNDSITFAREVTTDQSRGPSGSQ
ncbi:alpha/beta hydrolase [Erythrobacter sp. QSSC1-22B]|nr:alpha/beta hydrolase [Erythrobacter sp. QSSC1-22B]